MVVVYYYGSNIINFGVSLATSGANVLEVELRDYDLEPSASILRKMNKVTAGSGRIRGKHAKTNNENSNSKS